MPKPILAVDIDGVINDYHTPFIKFTNKKLGFNNSYDDFSSHNFHNYLGVNKQELVDLLNEFEDTYKSSDHILLADVINSLDELKQHYKIIAITGRRPILEKVTLEFMDTHLPFIKTYFAVGRNNLDIPKNRTHKPRRAEELGASYLIDDNEDEFIHWDSKKVKPICFAQPWNKILEKTHPHIPRLQWRGIKKHLMDDISKTKIN